MIDWSQWAEHWLVHTVLFTWKQDKYKVSDWSSSWQGKQWLAEFQLFIFFILLIPPERSIICGVDVSSICVLLHPHTDTLKRKTDKGETVLNIGSCSPTDALWGNGWRLVYLQYLCSRLLLWVCEHKKKSILSKVETTETRAGSKHNISWHPGKTISSALPVKIQRFRHPGHGGLGVPSQSNWTSCFMKTVHLSS